jgi:hypothetical protein
MKESRGWVDQARELKKKGIEQERAGGKGAGRQTFSDAATLYTQATRKMGVWCEPTSLEVSLTAEQRSYYVTPLAAERDVWIREAATLGPLMAR